MDLSRWLRGEAVYLYAGRNISHEAAIDAEQSQDLAIPVECSNHIKIGNHVNFRKAPDSVMHGIRPPSTFT